MILVVGGVFQGKEKFIRKSFMLEKITEAEKASYEELWQSECILNYHKIVRHQTEKNEDPLVAAKELILKNPGVIISMDEVGSGVIPMDKMERIYREQVGRTAACFAGEAEAVYRLVCGIPQRLK